MAEMMRVLCVCEGGNCRSVALAMQLKMHCQVDAVAAGWRWNTPTTLRILGEWADWILVLERRFAQRLDAALAPKIRVYDVGPDRWGNPFSMDLNLLLQKMLRNDPVFTLTDPITNPMKVDTTW